MIGRKERHQASARGVIQTAFDPHSWQYEFKNKIGMKDICWLATSFCGADYCMYLPSHVRNNIIRVQTTEHVHSTALPLPSQPVGKDDWHCDRANIFLARKLCLIGSKMDRALKGVETGKSRTNLSPVGPRSPCPCRGTIRERIRALPILPI